MPAAVATESPRLLIADDQSDVLQALELLLRNEQFSTRAVASPDAVMQALAREPFDLLLMDLNYTRDTTSGREGLDLLSRVQALDASLPIVVMTGWSHVELAVETMRRGVRDFVQKPWNNAQLLTVLRDEVRLGRQRRAANRAHEREVTEARLIQERLLPRALPCVNGVDLAGGWRPARDVSGDCYDIIRFDDRTIGISIADVMGKGLPAGLLMANLQAAVRAFATPDASPSSVCDSVNRMLCDHMTEGRFISFFYCRIDTETQTVTYSNAGHYPPVLVRRQGSVVRLSEGGAVMGIFPEWRFEDRSVDVTSGDRIVFFTDGITDARRREEEFGEDRLLDVIIRNRRQPAEGLHDAIMSAVSRFCGGTFDDDATLLVVGIP